MTTIPNTVVSTVNDSKGFSLTIYNQNFALVREQRHIDLNQGKVRVYKADKRGNLQFLGEELIDHTPRDELARFYIGDSFDVVGDRKCTNRRKVSSSVTEDSFEISIRNRKENRAQVWVVERFGGDCKILKSSHTCNKLDARTVEFPITVETGSEVKIIYSVRTIN